MFISVPATSANLGPGFDTLGLAINLRNEITIKPSRVLILYLTRGEGAEKPTLLGKNILIYWNHSFIPPLLGIFKGKRRITFQGLEFNPLNFPNFLRRNFRRRFRPWWLIKLSQVLSPSWHFGKAGKRKEDY